MASISLDNLTRSQALELLKNVQNTIAKGLAIAGNHGYEYIVTNTVLATINPKLKFDDGRDLEKPDFTKYTFYIYSGYFVENSLRQFAGIE